MINVGILTNVCVCACTSMRVCVSVYLYKATAKSV